MRFSKFFATSFVALIAACGASAQQVGTYTGTAHDGSPVTIVVAVDPNNSGKLELKTVSIDAQLPCRKTKETLSYVGIGISDGDDIADDGTAAYASSSFFDIDLVTSMTFKGKNSVKGKIGANLAAFVPAEGHTTLTNQTQACVSPNQSFTATFSHADISRALPSGVVTVRSPQGTATIHQGK